MKKSRTFLQCKQENWLVSTFRKNIFTRSPQPFHLYRWEVNIKATIWISIDSSHFFINIIAFPEHIYKHQKVLKPVNSSSCLNRFTGWCVKRPGMLRPRLYVGWYWPLVIRARSLTRTSASAFVTSAAWRPASPTKSLSLRKVRREKRREKSRDSLPTHQTCNISLRALKLHKTVHVFIGLK